MNKQNLILVAFFHAYPLVMAAEISEKYSNSHKVRFN